MASKTFIGRLESFQHFRLQSFITNLKYYRGNKSSYSSTRAYIDGNGTEL